MKTTYRCTQCNDPIEVEAYPHMSRPDEWEAEVKPCKRCYGELEEKIDDLEAALEEEREA